MPLPPLYEPAEAEALAAERFGLAVRARVLHGYADKNFLLVGDDGKRWVLKVAHADEEEACLDAQNELLARLAAARLPVPRVKPDREGRTLGTLRAGDGRAHLVRLVDWLPGTLLLELPEHGTELLEDVGAVVGRVARALDGFDPPALRRRMPWDLAQALDVRPLTDAISDPARRAWADEEYAHFADATRARLDACPQAVIHGDANDHNVLAGGDPLRVTGLIDFGDAVHSARVCDPAIAAAYAMLAKPEPLAAGAAVLRGYLRAAPLGPDELALVLDLVRLRIAVSVTFSAHEARLRPGDAYLDVTRSNTWALLERLRATPRAEASEAFLAAIA